MLFISISSTYIKSRLLIWFICNDFSALQEAQETFGIDFDFEEFNKYDDEYEYEDEEDDFVDDEDADHRSLFLDNTSNFLKKLISLRDIFNNRTI